MRKPRVVNSALNSLESRVLVTARKFRELGASEEDAQIPELKVIDEAARLPQALELATS